CRRLVCWEGPNSKKYSKIPWRLLASSELSQSTSKLGGRLPRLILYCFYIFCLHDKMATTNKKITYNSDFKLKVLEHYLKNGGDSKYGLKTKTCARFNINKKTINR
ncbi:unnamed protein product, partial [Meganyctiphanes norvegica]